MTDVDKLKIKFDRYIIAMRKYLLLNNATDAETLELIIKIKQSINDILIGTGREIKISDGPNGNDEEIESPVPDFDDPVYFDTNALENALGSEKRCLAELLAQLPEWVQCKPSYLLTKHRVEIDYSTKTLFARDAEGRSIVIAFDSLTEIIIKDQLNETVFIAGQFPMLDQFKNHKCFVKKSIFTSDRFQPEYLVEGELKNTLNNILRFKSELKQR